MNTLATHFRQVLRRLGRAPMFTAITLVTLAAGVGANTVVFSVLECVLLKPLSYPHAEDLVSVSHIARGDNFEDLTASPSTYFIYREQGTAFQDIGLYDGDSVSVTGVAEPEQVQALKVTDGTLPILGVPPMLGHWFTRKDDLPGNPQTVVLTYGYWRSKFGGSSSIVGRTITVDGKPREIIGVMPQRFHFLDQDDPALILPLQLDRNKTLLGQFSHQALARLKPGATVAQANADMARMLPIVNRSFPVPPGFSLKLFEDLRIEPNVHPLKQEVVGDVGNVLWVLMGSIGMVLLITCANAANLLLVRVEGRRQELAVRAALGAGRERIAADLLLESVILGLLGSAIGLGFAYGTLHVLVAIAPAGLPRIHEIGINVPVLLFTFAVSLLASLLVAFLPIFKYAGTRPGAGLHEGGRTHSHGKEQHRARNVLVVVQVALALVLLICSGLMIRTFRELTRVHPGFTGPAEVQTFRISIPEAEVPDAERVVQMHAEILRKITALPGVSSAGLSSGIPMGEDDGGWRDPIFARDRTYAEGQVPPVRQFKFITPGFLETLGTPVIAGHDLAWTDIYNNIPVALVSENLAREYWHDPANALGKQIRVGSDGKNDDWRQVIGVVADMHYDGMNKEAPTAVYWPIRMNRFEGSETVVGRDVAFAVRSPRTGSENLLADLQRTVWSVDPNLPLAEVHTLNYFYRKSMARTSFTLVMLGVAGSMALLLGVVGIYGVLAYSVSQRTREIGIRMALGEQRWQVISMFVRHGLLLTVIGVACGLGAATALMRLMSSLLFHVSPVDPATYCAVSAGLVTTALLASYLPSRRAAAVNPAEALRAE